MAHGKDQNGSSVDIEELIKGELHRHAASSVDLSNRNSLLNLNLKSTTKQIAIVDELPNEMCKSLLDGKAFRFHSIEKSPNYPTPLELDQGTRSLPFYIDLNLPLPDSDSVEKRHSDLYLQTNFEIASLQARLKQIHSFNASQIEEKGITTLFIALGMLKYTDSKASDIDRYAPLCLIPVQILRNRSRQEYSISCDTGQMMHNNALSMRLEHEYGLQLPEIESTETKPEDYFSDVIAMVNDNGFRWDIVRQARLGFFNYSGLVIQEDLNPEKWKTVQTEKGNVSALVANSNIQMILAGVGAPDEQGSPEDYMIDEHPVGRRVVTPMPADSSQMSAIIDAVEGKSLVIEGPPGTGKSQTITNLIAMSIQEGKKVLFVSEKPAALDVVSRKLESIGLGLYTLYLHSAKTKPVAVYQKLSERLSYKPGIMSSTDGAQKKLEKHRENIDTYLSEIHQERQPLGSSVNQLIWDMNQRISDGGVVEVLSGVESVINSSNHESRLDLFNELSQVDESIDLDKCSPWHWLDASLYKSTSKSEIESLCSQISHQLQILEDLTDHACSALDLKEEGLLNVDLSVCQKLQDLIEELEDEPRLVSILRCYSESDHSKIASRLKDVENSSPTAFSLELSMASDISRQASQNENLVTNLEISVDTLLKESDRSSRLLNNLIELLPEVLNVFGEWSSWTLADLRRLLACFEAFEVLMTCEVNELTPAMLSSSNIADWMTHLEVAHQLNAEKESLSSVYSVGSIPPESELERLHRQALFHESQWLRWLRPKWRRHKKEVQALLSTPATSPEPYMSKSLGRLLEHKRKVRSLGLFRPFAGSDIRADIESKRDLDQKSKIGPALHILREQDRALKISIRRVFEWFLDSHSQLDRPGIEHAIDAFLSEIPISQSYEATRLGPLPEQKLGELDAQFRSLESFAICLRRLVDYKSCYIDMSLKQSLHDCRGRVSESEISALIRKYGCNTDVNEIKFPSDLSWLKKSLSLSKTLSDSQYFSDTLHCALREVEPISRCHELISYVRKSAGVKSEIQDGLQTCLSLLGNTEVEDGEIFHKAALLCDVVAEHLGTLPTWRQLSSIRNRARDLAIDKWVDRVIFEQQSLMEIKAGYLASVYNQILGSIYSGSAILNSTNGDQLESARVQFREVDEELRQLGIAVANQKCFVPVAEVTQGSRGPRVKDKTELHLIRNEIAKKTRHLKIRPLYRRASGALLDLQPCMLLNPTSVAQVLPKECELFDLVIFDEASQIRPGDALGAIARAKQFVVVGDPNQLPPSDDFLKKLDPEDIDPEESLASADSESILEVAQRSMPTQRYRRLKMHYRSDHESLIAFSNTYFYNDELIVFPAPSAKRGELGVDFHYIEDGEFVSGAGVNPKEAESVVDLVIEHARKYSSSSFVPSIGIATMNKTQAVLIQDLLDKRYQTDTSSKLAIDKLYSLQEPLFIKNLAEVQGDERDTIIISFTYGKEPGSNSVPQRFGPINRDGGWRRLNVLVTRARRNVRVVSSMLESDIVADINKKGCNAMRNYIEYARTGRLVDRGLITDRPPDSGFERSVAAVLRGMGLDAVPQVGVSGYFIDIGVRLPGSNDFLLGIECDGATYHSSRSARDRDVIRQDVIESKGWSLHRIWSTDWYTNREHAIDVLAEKIQACIEAVGTSAPVQ